FGTTAATANPYQKVQTGVYDNWRFRLWRTVMPTPGDANTYGACELFGGRIANSKVERGKISFSIQSFLDVVNQQVPPNVIELNNTLTNFAGATPVVSDSETVIAQFAAVAGSTVTSILANCTAPTASKIYGTNKFQRGYMVWNSGSTLAGYLSPIARKQHSAGHSQCIVYAPFPWAPTAGDTFYCSIQPPVNLQDAATGFEYFGFPYVPQPESAA